jgi:hypothetical protein
VSWELKVCDVAVNHHAQRISSPAPAHFTPQRNKGTTTTPTHTRTCPRQHLRVVHDSISVRAPVACVGTPQSLLCILHACRVCVPLCVRRLPQHLPPPALHQPTLLRTAHRVRATALVQFEPVARIGHAIATLPASTAGRCTRGARAGPLTRTPHPSPSPPRPLHLARHWRTALAPSRYAEARPCLIVLPPSRCVRQCSLLMIGRGRSAMHQVKLCFVVESSVIPRTRTRTRASAPHSSCPPVSCAVPVRFAARALQ